MCNCCIEYTYSVPIVLHERIGLHRMKRKLIICSIGVPSFEWLPIFDYQFSSASPHFRMTLLHLIISSVCLHCKFLFFIHFITFALLLQVLKIVFSYLYSRPHTQASENQNNDKLYSTYKAKRSHNALGLGIWWRKCIHSTQYWARMCELFVGRSACCRERNTYTIVNNNFQMRHINDARVECELWWHESHLVWQAIATNYNGRIAWPRDGFQIVYPNSNLHIESMPRHIDSASVSACSEAK